MKTLLTNFKSKNFWLKLVLALLVVSIFFVMMPSYSFKYVSFSSCLIFLAGSLILTFILLLGIHHVLNTLFAKYPNVKAVEWKFIYFIVCLTTYTVAMSIVDYVLKGVTLSMTAIVIFAIILSLDKVKRLKL